MYNYLADPCIPLSNNKIRGWVICFINDSCVLDLYHNPFQYQLDQRKYCDHVYFKFLKDVRAWLKNNEIDSEYLRKL